MTELDGLRCWNCSSNQIDEIHDDQLHRTSGVQKRLAYKCKICGATWY